MAGSWSRGDVVRRDQALFIGSSQKRLVCLFLLGGLRKTFADMKDGEGDSLLVCYRLLGLSAEFRWNRACGSKSKAIPPSRSLIKALVATIGIIES